MLPLLQLQQPLASAGGVVHHQLIQQWLLNSNAIDSWADVLCIL
jgi:hypothetical protein